MTNYLFNDFKEVEESIKRLAPPIIYKYRADWSNPYHKEFITNQTLWFAAPRDLNDPYDIRTPVRFDFTEIEHPIFLSKLKKHFLENKPSAGFAERDINVICENKLDEIRQDPKAYFEKNYRDIREGDIYDRVGLFSCTTDELNETMWAHYGNNHKGFAVGFNTVELSRKLLCSIGPVKYNDEIPIYSFINPKMDYDFDTYFLKSKKWEYEKEFRYFTIGDDANIDRVKIYPVSSVTEFLLGSNFPKEQKDDFVNEVRKIFLKSIPIYQAKPKVSGFGLEKTIIA